MQPVVPHWKAPWGDRRTELVVIGQDMDHAAVKAALEACVVTDEEMSDYADTFVDDHPFFLPFESRIAGTPEDLEERIKRYNIEILAPKSKQTQVLMAAPKSIEVLSAHSCIAEFQGIESWGGLV